MLRSGMHDGTLRVCVPCEEGLGSEWESERRREVRAWVAENQYILQIVVPYTLEARQDSIVVLWLRACPSMLWYSCKQPHRQPGSLYYIAHKYDSCANGPE
jgi:hypothetical protein